ncbi:MAG: hypothetical protein JWM33_1850 [Caulobacteraceae bacterium]|nr:hypothetical protein [Caulobacteraceae bacterium]
MSRLFASLAIGLLAALAAFAPAQAGPAWWRVSDGASVLWILGVPDVTLTQFDWDQSSLKHRLGKADRLYDPTLGGTFVRPPPSALRLTSVRSTIPITGGFAPTQIAISTDPTRAPPSEYVGPWAPSRAAFVTAPALLARVKAAADKRNVFAYNRLKDNETYVIANWLDQTNWPRGAIGNAVAWQAFKTGALMNVPTTQIIITDTSSVRPPQAVQEACLGMILEESESGLMPKIRGDGLAAWARGDLDHALKRGSDLIPCLHGQEPSTDASALYERGAFLYYNVTDGAFGQPGRQSVAVVALDPLLADHGVLAHYRQLGYQISLSDGMGE